MVRWKATWGEKDLQPLVTVHLEIRRGAQGRNIDAGTGAEVMKEDC